ncbi:MAG: radical SAM protein [Clostridia bacterium]|nr:radical SAM protein [Clostridia bacterium]
MDRDYIYYEYTNSLCNECMKVIPAKIVFKDNKVYILKFCPEHGEQLELIEHDVEYYKHKRDFDKSGTISKTQTEIKNGCPYDCGLCPNHDQHSCINLIEITNRCNMCCNTCYANSSKGEDLEMSLIEKMMDFAVDAEGGRAEIVQISGGEPTLHKDIINIIKMAREKFQYVMLNTNGIRIAEDESFVKELSQFVGKFEIYLQFDSFEDKTYNTIRGRNLKEIKQKAIDNLIKYNIPITLVMTVERDINDNEIGKVISYGLETKGVRGINIQPVAYFGRKIGNVDRKNRVTMTDVIQKIEEQTKKMLIKEDFLPLPCNVEKVSLTYLYKTKEGFIPITRANSIKNYLPYINNTFTFKIEDALTNGKDILFGGCCNPLKFLKDFKKFVPNDFMSWPMDKRSEYVSENTFRITITSFIDKYNFDMKSMQKECVHIVTKDLKRIPFSSYNMIYRNEGSNE